MKSAGADLIVANDVARVKTGFGTDTNEVFIIDLDRNINHIKLSDKYNIAAKIIDKVKANI